MPRLTLSSARLLALGLCSVLLAACGGAEEEESPKACTVSCSGIDVPDEGPFDFKVALTFDDGPSVATTPQVIATLHEEVEQQLDNNEHLLDSLGVEYSFFRFPFGASTCATMNTVRSRGYKPRANAAGGAGPSSPGQREVPSLLWRASHAQAAPDAPFTPEVKWP